MADNLKQAMKAFDLLGTVQDGMPLAKFHGYSLSPMLPLNWMKIYNFDFQEEDVIINSFPKSGTHWVYYIAALLKTRNFGELTELQQISLIEIPYWQTELEDLANLPPPRLVATHLGGPLLPKNSFKAKFIYVYRDPRDVLVSEYHHYIHLSTTWPYDKPFDEFVDQFIRGDIFGGPYPQHLKDILKLKNEGKPILFISYEDLQDDVRTGIRKIADFLEETVDDDFIEKVAVAVQADSMKNNKSANGNVWQKRIDCKPETKLVRKAKSGGWKAEFQEYKEAWAKYEKFIEDNIPIDFVNRKL